MHFYTDNIPGAHGGTQNDQKYRTNCDNRTPFSTLKEIRLFDAAKIIFQSYIHFSSRNVKRLSADVCLLLKGVNKNKQDRKDISDRNNTENGSENSTMFYFFITAEPPFF